MFPSFGKEEPLRLTAFKRVFATDGSAGDSDYELSRKADKIRQVRVKGLFRILCVRLLLKI